MAMTGANESARVSASKVLLDALAEPARGCPECEARAAEPGRGSEAARAVRARRAARKKKLRAAVHEELSLLAEHADVSTVEQRLVDRL
jgi:hypothetical protein